MGDLDNNFFNLACNNLHTDSPLIVDAISQKYQSKGSSIITELTSHKTNKLIGHFPFVLKTIDGQKLEVMAKIKPLDEEVIIMLNSMAAMCDTRLSQSFNHFRHHIGFKGCHIKELAVMAQQDPRFTQYAPKVYGIIEDAEREAYVIVEEHLQDVELLDSADDTHEWGRSHIEAAIKGIAAVHSIWYGKEEELKQQTWMVDYPTAQGTTHNT